MAPTIKSSMTPITNSVTKASTTGTLDEDDYQALTNVQSATTDQRSKSICPTVPEMDIQMIINFTFSATSLVSLATLLILVMVVCIQKKGTKKPKSINELSKMEEFTTHIAKPNSYFPPYFEEKDDS